MLNLIGKYIIGAAAAKKPDNYSDKNYKWNDDGPVLSIDVKYLTSTLFFSPCV